MSQRRWTTAVGVKLKDFSQFSLFFLCGVWAKWPCNIKIPAQNSSLLLVEKSNQIQRVWPKKQGSCGWSYCKSSKVKIKHSKWCKWGVDLLLRAQIWSFILKFFYPVFLADLKKLMILACVGFLLLGSGSRPPPSPKLILTSGWWFMLGKECEFGAIRVTVNVGVGTFGEISTLPIGGLSIPHSKSHQKDDVQSRKPRKIGRICPKSTILRG